MSEQTRWTSTEEEKRPAGRVSGWLWCRLRLQRSKCGCVVMCLSEGDVGRPDCLGNGSEGPNQGGQDHFQQSVMHIEQHHLQWSYSYWSSDPVVFSDWSLFSSIQWTETWNNSWRCFGDVFRGFITTTDWSLCRVYFFYFVLPVLTDNWLHFKTSVLVSLL